MQWKKIKEIVIKLAEKEYYDKLQISITSNLGITYGDLCSFSKDYNIGFLTNLDGFEKEHNTLRPSRGRNGNFNVIVENIKKLRSCGVKCDIRTTVTNVNLPILNEFSAFLKNDFQECENYNFPPIAVFDSSGKLINLSLIPDINDYLAFLESLVTKQNIHISNIYPLNSFVRTFFSKDNFIKPCGMVRGQVLQIDPNGHIWPCSYLSSDNEYLLGNVRNLDVFSEEWIRKMTKRLHKFSNFKNDSPCFKCDLRNLCGGDFSTPWNRVNSLDENSKQIVTDYLKGTNCFVAELVLKLMCTHITKNLREF